MKNKILVTNTFTNHLLPFLPPSSRFTCRYGPQQGSQAMMTGPNSHHSHHHAANDFPSGSSALNAATVVAAATATATATARVVAMQETRQHHHHQHQQDAMHGMGINSMNSMGNGMNSHMNMSASVTGNNMNNMSTQGMHYQQQQQQVNEPVIDMLEIFLSSLLVSPLPSSSHIITFAFFAFFLFFLHLLILFSHFSPQLLPTPCCEIHSVTTRIPEPIIRLPVDEPANQLAGHWSHESDEQHECDGIPANDVR